MEIIVTRHPHLAAVITERGIAPEGTPVLEHATGPDVDGKHVIGILPTHLAARAASVTAIPMRWSLEQREALQRGDLDLEATREAACDPLRYVVQRVGRGGIDQERPRWLAWAAAMFDVEESGTHFGAGPHWKDGETVFGLPTIWIYDATECYSVQLLPSRGVWRRRHGGPWLDGYSVEVDPATIKPACNWEPPPQT